MREATVRPSARVVLLDARDRVLLFRWVDPRLKIPSLWTTPGGGVQPAESWEQAALRELREETGLAGVGLGPCVWHRRVTVPFADELIEAHERYYLVRVPGHQVDVSGMEPGESAAVSGHRWWSLDELAGARDEVFAPRRIADLLEPLLRGEVPASPVPVDE
jgi:ADP-ribose pyrophosphatase YjhB (NUDIX family)